MNSLKVLNSLKEKKLKIAFAESLTGGSIASELVRHPGASDVFELAVVAYSKKMKKKLLNVDEKLIIDYGIVSKQVAEKMALEIKKLSGSDISVGTTGNAGPSIQRGSRLGEVWICVSFLDDVKHYFFQFENNREAIIKETVRAVFTLLNQLLDNYK